MTKKAKWTSLILVALCLVAVPAVVAPAAALAQGAEEEYNLDLPGSGGDQNTPAANNAANTSASDDDGGFPMLVIVLFAAAGVAVGLALWRLAVGRRMGEADEDDPRV